MKKLMLAGIALTALLTAPAIATDLPITVRPYGPPTFGWTGWYVGTHVGWLWATAEITDQSHFDSGATTVLKDDSPAVGVQGGYNLQIGSAVYGIEVDATWTNAERSYPGNKAQYSTKWNVIGTTRGRLGLAVDQTLAYVTTGVAWANFDTVYDTDIPSGSRVGSVSSKSTWGWVAGVGVEHALFHEWTVKLEALYTRFSGDFDVIPGVACGTVNGPNQHCKFAFDHAAWTVRIGANYRFGLAGYLGLAGY
jgi:outer membrane immunogenic protein